MRRAAKLHRGVEQKALRFADQMRQNDPEQRLLRESHALLH